MKKFILLSIIFLSVLSGCKKEKELKLDYREIEFRTLEMCENDCIKDVDEFKAQLQVMIDQIDDYMLDNGYIVEGCVEDLTKECFESKEGYRYISYIDTRLELMAILDSDLEVNDDIVQTSFSVEYSSATIFQKEYEADLYLNDEFFMIVKKDTNEKTYEIYIDYSDGFDTEVIERYHYEDTIEMNYNSYMNEVGFTVGVTYQDMEISGKTLAIGVYDNAFYYSTNEVYGNTSRFVIRSDDYYQLHEYTSTTMFAYGNSNNANNINKAVYEETGVIIEGRGDEEYHISLDLILFDDWTHLDTYTEYGFGTSLYNGKERIEELFGYEIRTYHMGLQAIATFTIDSDDVLEFVETLDSELDLSGVDSFEYMLEQLTAFENNYEEILDDHDIIYTTDDIFFEEFFEIE